MLADYTWSGALRAPPPGLADREGGPRPVSGRGPEQVSGGLTGSSPTIEVTAISENRMAPAVYLRTS